MKIGDTVEVVGTPPNLHDHNDLKTRSLFESCVGKVFRIEGFETPTGMSSPLIRLDVGHIVGKQSWEHTIWIEPEFVKIVAEDR